ncbi:MAG: riboflavin synthase [Dongiaceae bacterium]
MFTGIITHQGRIAKIKKTGDWLITIETGLAEDSAVGASIACSGVCLTVIEKTASQFSAQISAETMEKTTSKFWQEGTLLNLERSLRVGDELGGHFVYGHVDGLAEISDIREEGESLRFTFTAPVTLAPYLAPKGSIALDGVSLTINEVENNRFGINIIPHTRKLTTFANARINDKVNLEVDMMARYIARMLGVMPYIKKVS